MVRYQVSNPYVPPSVICGCRMAVNDEPLSVQAPVSVTVPDSVIEDCADRFRSAGDQNPEALLLDYLELDLSITDPSGESATDRVRDEAISNQ